MSLAAEQSGALTGLPPVVRWLVAALFVLSIPIFIIVGNVLEVARDVEFIERGFVKYQVGRTTGLDPAQLHLVAETFVRYLRDPSASLDLTVGVGGTRRPLFNRRELAHMVDVQHLFLLAGRARLVAGAILLIVPLLGLLAERGAFQPRLGAMLTVGGILTVGVLLLLGALSLVDFTELWTRFHHVAFTNDLWILDPRTDYLIMLFPEGFWFDAVMRIAMLSALEAVVLGAAGLGLVFWGERRAGR